MSKQPKTISRVFTIKVFLFAVLTIACAGIAFDILFPDYKDNFIVSFILKNFWGNVCHQEHNKSLSINGTYLMVCSRCAGIYFGAWFVSFISMFIKQIKINLSLIIICTIPMLADILFYNIRIYEYSKVIAFFSGVIFSSSVVIFFLNNIKSEL